MSTAERDVHRREHRPAANEAAYNAALEDAGLRERSNFKTGERSRSYALRRSERKPGGGAKVRYAGSVCVVLYFGIRPTSSFSCRLLQQILAALGVTTGDRVKLAAFPQLLQRIATRSLQHPVQGLLAADR